jgi:hypothetical protein
LPNDLPIFQRLIFKKSPEHTRGSLRELFQTQLQSTSNLQEIGIIIKTLGLNLVHDPFFSELAFDHIVTTNYKLASEFLLDPLLNPPTANNYSRVVIYLKESVATKGQRKTLLQAIFQGFCVGLIRREQAQLIFQHLPDILINSKDGPIPARHTPRINKYYSIILRCLTECNVFNTRDLGVDILNAWIGHIKDVPYDHYTAKLILSLTKSVAICQATERFRTDSRLFHDFLSQAESTTTSSLTERWLEILCEQPARRERDLKHLSQILTQRPPGVLRSVVVEMPNRLAVSIRNGKLSPEVLLVWEQVLRSFEKETVALILGNRLAWAKMTAVTDAGLTANVQLVLRLWTALTLCNGAAEPLRILQQMDFPSQLRRHFKESDPGLLWGKILLTLQSLPKLGSMDGLFDFITKSYQPQSAEDVVRTAKHQAAVGVFKSQGFAVFQSDKTYLRALRRLSDPLTELAESINTDIGGFARIVLPLIARDKLSLRIVTRILKHNQAFHFALMNTWSLSPGSQTQLSKLNGSVAGVSRLTQLATILTGSGDQNFREAVLRLMHDLAIAFALSPALSNRQALRKVFWCYSFLHRYGAPIHSPITKALWYAGVTRCEGRGTPRRVLAWLFRKVREVEGRAVVEALIRNRDLRTKRAREVWVWGRRLGKGLCRDDENVTREGKSIARGERKLIASRRALVADEQALHAEKEALVRNEDWPLKITTT